MWVALVCAVSIQQHIRTSWLLSREQGRLAPARSSAKKVQLDMLMILQYIDTVTKMGGDKYRQGAIVQSQAMQHTITQYLKKLQAPISIKKTQDAARTTHPFDATHLACYFAIPSSAQRYTPDNTRGPARHQSDRSESEAHRWGQTQTYRRAPTYAPL